MLIGCITETNFEKAKRQIEKANQLCDGVEFRFDLLGSMIPSLKPFVKGFFLVTEHNKTLFSDGRTMSCYHNFDHTPSDLSSILQKLPKADFYKIATMAKTTTDSLRMLNFVKKQKNVVGMCVGSLGQITRILSPVVKNPLTFAALGKEAALGQLQVEELLETYHFSSLDPTTKVLGLIGNPIEQSPSHLTHNAWFKKKGMNAVYVRMLLTEEELPEFFENAKELGFLGLSVTIPFKEKVFLFVDEMEEEANEIQAINTLTFLNNKIIGANTDAKGALDAIEEKCSVCGKSFVILGAGGSSKAIAYEARKRKAKVEIFSRRYGNLDQVANYDILVNTTPIPLPIDPSKILPQTFFMDINVAHENSLLMQTAREKNCSTISGMEMFKHQAKGQFQYWFKTISPICPLSN